MRNDPQLCELLHRWEAPRVPAHFDQGVWRRIRQRASEPGKARRQSSLTSQLRHGNASPSAQTTSTSAPAHQESTIPTPPPDQEAAAQE